MPMRAPDPHNLRTAATINAVIDADRECPGCGYNLRGLRLGIPCPECGMPSTNDTFGSIDDPLSLAPPRVILILIRGCWAAIVIIALTAGLVMLPRFVLWTDEWSRWGMLALSGLWAGAVMWLTPALGIPQAATRGFSRRSRVRAAARWLQSGWIVAAAANVLHQPLAGKPPFDALLDVAAFVGVAAGIAGMVILAILLERLANWARDDSAETMFNWAQWTIPISMLVMAFGIPLLGAGFMSPLAILTLGVLVLGVGVFPYGLLTLSSSVTLSIVHNYEHRQRGERRAEREEQHAQQVQRTIQTMDNERARRGHA